MCCFCGGSSAALIQQQINNAIAAQVPALVTAGIAALQTQVNTLETSNGKKRTLLDYSAINVGNNNDLNEKVLKSFNIPANTFNADNKILYASFWGFTAANGSTKTLAVRLGPVTLTGTVIFTKAVAWNNRRWNLELYIGRRIVDSQHCRSVFVATDTVLINALDRQTVAAVNDDASAMLIECTGKTSVAAPDDIVCEGHEISIIGPP